MNILSRATRRVSVMYRSAVEFADAGMSTAEYAVGTVAAVSFAVVLFKIINGGSVAGLLSSIIDKALSSI